MVGAAAEDKISDSFTPSPVASRTTFVSGRIPSYSAVDPDIVGATSLAPDSDHETDCDEDMAMVARGPAGVPPVATASACTALPNCHGSAEAPAGAV
ncbi:hypothetical protein [Streptomyces sp. H39-C1]|uniref:hypothetical protein n=1 Tax=Streptomyces sp. H39-C1 TaxID=3004355 RepID=UPI0022AF9307|nr:hypothetical protein [Streptomyces sp. H39-C1]MCZ4102530.1 hypothetical protein [Streptomyces sp. H39-C1]